MQLVRLVYYSRPVKATTPEEVLQILKSAMVKNERLGITGALAVSNNYFVQVLEGSRAHVSKLIFEIAADKRHDDVTLVSFEEVNARLFAKWSMSLYSITFDDEAVLFNYATLPKLFDPTVMRPQALLEFLQDLSRMDYPGLVLP